MEEPVINLGIKFVRAYKSTPVPVPEPTVAESAVSGNDATSWLAQTGDLNIALLVGLVLLALTIGWVIGYAIAKNRQFAIPKHSVQSSFKLINFSNFSMSAKIVFLFASAIAIICIAVGCISINAHATNNNVFTTNEDTPINVTPDTITAFVTEDGRISSWDRSSAILTNISANDSFDFTSCTVSLTDEAKNVDTLKQATIKINGFKGKEIFNSKAGEEEHSLKNLSLDGSDSTHLDFYIEDVFDIAQLDSLFDKPIFKISLKITDKYSGPSYDNLYEYNINELKQVSNYLAKHYSEEADYDKDDIRYKFRNFRDNGIKVDAEGRAVDNGVCMSQNPNAKNHWAIDENGNLFKQENFLDNKNTIQVRIIGICEDYADAEHTQKIGLTFMTTHALVERSKYNSGDATFGWAGSEHDGSCTLRTFLKNNSTSTEEKLFPLNLYESVVSVAKGYQYSKEKSSGNNTASI